MFTEQVAAIKRAVDRITDASVREAVRPLAEGIADAIGNCAQSLVHRGNTSWEGDSTVAIGNNGKIKFGNTSYTMQQINELLASIDTGGGTSTTGWVLGRLTSTKTLSDDSATADVLMWGGIDPGGSVVLWDPGTLDDPLFDNVVDVSIDYVAFGLLGHDDRYYFLQDIPH